MTEATAAKASRCKTCLQVPQAPNHIATRWGQCWTCQCGDAQDRYPVIVTYTQRHIVWVEGDTQDEAVASLRDAPYESTDDNQTMESHGCVVEAPDLWDWPDVYGSYGETYPDQTANAHVEEHRAHLRRQDRELLAAYTHDEDLGQEAGRLAPEDRITCSACSQWRTPDHDTGVYHVNTVEMAARLAAYDAKRAETARAAS